MVQFGDVEYKDGDGGVSSFKKKYFADENFDVGTHDKTSCPGGPRPSSSSEWDKLFKVVLRSPDPTKKEGLVVDFFTCKSGLVPVWVMDVA